MTTFIYALLDPRDGAMRYVGKTDDPKRRLAGHLRQCKWEDTHKARWIKLLLAQGLKPLLEIVDEVEHAEWKAAECAYILFFKEAGCALANGTLGGDGFASGEDNPAHLPEVRAKIRAARKGMKFSPEHLANMSAANKGKTQSLAARLKNSLAHKGKSMSVEARAKLSAVKKGKPIPPEQRARLLACNTGRKHSAEARANMSAARMGRVFSAETRAKISASQKARLARGQLFLALAT